MYSVKNQSVAKAIESYSPLYGVCLKNTDSNKIYTGDYLFSAVTEGSSTTLSDDIELGAVCAQLLSVKITGVADEKFLGQNFKLFMYLKDRSGSTITYGELTVYTYLQLATGKVIGEILHGELIPMGKFTCVKHKKNGDMSELELYDRLYFSDDIYNCSFSFPSSSRVVENDICNQLGCKNGNSYSESAYMFDKNEKSLYEKDSKRLKTKSFEFTISSIPKNCTKRQMLSYIATANGQFGFIDRYGNYLRKWYGNSVKNLDNNTIDEPIVSEKANQIIGVICTVPSLTDDSQSILTVGNTDKTQGRVLEIENPYMTVSLLNSLFVKVRELSWYTSEVKQRLGDPRFDLGDVITYKDIDNRVTCNIPITNLKFEYNGGFAADISSVGLNEEELL